MMNKTNSLKSLYGLEYDKSGFESSLISWYNRLIDKSVDELSVADVSKMIRQDILKNIAVDRAIELFLSEPFIGEMMDGDLLDLLVSCGTEVKNSTRKDLLIVFISKLDNNLPDWDWLNEDDKSIFKRNVHALKSILVRASKDIRF